MWTVAEHMYPASPGRGDSPRRRDQGLQPSGHLLHQRCPVQAVRWMGGPGGFFGGEVVMVGASGSEAMPRTAPTDSAGHVPIVDRTICTPAALTASIRGRRLSNFTGADLERGGEFRLFSGGTRAVGASVETDHTVSSALSVSSIAVDHPALPSDPMGGTVRTAPGVNTATSRSASHGGRAVAAVTAHLLGPVGRGRSTIVLTSAPAGDDLRSTS